MRDGKWSFLFITFTLDDNRRETNLQQMNYVDVGWIDDWTAECADVADAEWTAALPASTCWSNKWIICIISSIYGMLLIREHP